MITDKIANRAVGLAKTAYNLVPAGVRLGKVYREHARLLTESRYWDREKIDRWQLARLRDLVREAGENTVYYNNLFREIGFESGDLKTLEDFRKLPLLDKKTAQSHTEELISRKYRREQLFYGTTGGSTGVPLGIFYVKNYYAAVEYAFLHDIWKQFGFKERHRQAIIRGSIIKGNVYEIRSRKLFLSSFHLTDENMNIYIDKINRYEPRYIQAYPSSISALCQYMKEHFIDPFPFVELVMCSSENLYPFQKALIEETLRVPVCNLYGNTERTVIAANFSNCENLHVYPQYGFSEILNANGNECEEGTHGEVVSTNFTNPGYYLIRYKTGDIAESGGDECGCGWRYKVFKHIEGREQEFLIAKDGKKVSMAALNVHSSIYDNVHQFQFEQNRQGEVLLKYVPKNGFSQTDEKNIYDSIKEILGTGFSLVLFPVTEIQRSGRGKYSMVRQNISVEKTSFSRSLKTQV